MLKPLLVGLMLAGCALPALAQSDCEVIAASAVDQALPLYAPWQVQTGGPGACMFEGSILVRGGSRYSVILKVNQQFKSSAADASAFVKKLEPTMAQSYALRKAGELGSAGFYYRPKDGKGPGQWWVAHQDKVVSMGMLVVPDRAELDEEDQSGLASLIKQVLAGGQKKGVAEKALSCPYFDRAQVSKLFASTAVTIQQYGQNSCLAALKTQALTLSLVEQQNGKLARQFVSDSADPDTCTVEDIADLGDGGGRLSYACKLGNANASGLVFAVGRTIVTMGFAPTQPATAEQRKRLVELARYAQQQIKSR